jgi:hypothetical protein
MNIPQLVVQLQKIWNFARFATDASGNVIGLDGLNVSNSKALTRVTKIVHGLNGATYSQSGVTVTVSLTGHLMTAALNGAEIYLAQSTGALLSGWFTNFTYVNANSFTCTSTVSQTTSGNLGTNTAETTVASHTLAPAELGLNGMVAIDAMYANNNSANNKTVACYLGAYQFHIQNYNTTTQGSIQSGFANTGSYTTQIATRSQYGSGFGGTTVAAPKGTIDTSAAQTVAIKITLANAGDFCALLVSSVTKTYIA